MQEREKNITIRDPVVTILEAELVASSAERVAEWLTIRAIASKESTEEHDEQLEAALLAREHPLINIALARYGIRDATLLQLFQPEQSASAQAIRIAVLANEALTRHNNMIDGLIGAVMGVRTEKAQWLVSLSDAELGTLLSNQSIGPDFLSTFLEGKNGWERLDDAHRRFAIRMIAKNPLVSAVHESVEIDGYEEYKHSAVQNAVWQLASTAPKTVSWCHALGVLFTQTIPEAFSIKDPLALAAQWAGNGEERIRYGYMGHFGEIRLQIARLALRSHGSGAEELLTQDDPALRGAAYRYGDLEEAQIQAAAERDPEFAFEKLVWNERLWRREPTRVIVRKLAWDQPDPSSHMDAQNTYLHIEYRMQKKYPSWFDGKDSQVDEDDLPVKRADLNQLSTDLTGRLDTMVAQFAVVQADTKMVRIRSEWLWWGVAAVVAILIYKFF